MNAGVSQDAGGAVSVAVLATESTVIDREESRSLEEMIFDTVTSVLETANMTPDDLDGVVVSGNDEIDGRVISIMPASGPAAGVGRDITMIASSADHALAYGYLRLLAGQGNRILVVGWAKPSESVDPDRAELMAAEPYVLRAVGMNHTIAAALQASKWREEGEDIEPVVGATLVAPLSKSDLPARGDSVHALIIATEGHFPSGTEIAWIADAGWATSSYELGGRDVSALDSLHGAIAQITKRNPEFGPGAWEAAEIAADSEYAVRAAARTLGIESARVNQAGALSELPTSPYVAGLGRMVAAIRAVASEGDPRVVAGIGFNGFAAQGTTVIVFSETKGGLA